MSSTQPTRDRASHTLDLGLRVLALITLAASVVFAVLAVLA